MHTWLHTGSPSKDVVQWKSRETSWRSGESTSRETKHVKKYGSRGEEDLEKGNVAHYPALLVSAGIAEVL